MKSNNKVADAIPKLLNNYWILGLLFIGYGLFLAYHDSLVADFYFLPGGCDGRLNHYFLEHSWLWISGAPLHSEFWNAPFFYPVKNVMAYSDVLLGTAPIYWLFRCLGISEINSFLLWPPSLAILNWLCMFLLLRKGFHTDNLSSGTGAFLFAFCAPRLNKLVHLQLWPQFYTVLFIYFLIIFYKKRETIKSHIALFFCAICMALQFYAGFYLGWFLLFGISVYLFSLVCIRKTRIIVINIIKNQYKFIILGAVLFFILVSPMLIHYMDVQKTVGHRSWGDIATYLPTINSWFSTPSFIYKGFDYIAASDGEFWIGIGFVVIFICLYGLIKYSSKNVWIRALLFCGIIIFCISTIRYGRFDLWKAVYLLFPGASAIRAVSRIFFILLIPLSIGYALAMSSRKITIQLILIFIVLLENSNWGIMANIRSQYEVSHMIASEAGKSNLAFVYVSNQDCGTFDKNLDAMWAGIFANRRTFNGYSGNFPSMAQYEVSSTPFDKIQNSEFLSHINEPYMLIISKDGKLKSKIINTDSMDLENVIN